MSEADENRERLIRFFEEVAEVMERHRDVARNFVLAEAESEDLEVLAEAAAPSEVPVSAMAADEALSSSAGQRRRVCIRFGIDPRTGQRVCLQWVDMR